MVQKKTKKPWGGRFKAELDPRVQRYTRSLHLDRRLALHDLRGSGAHVRMLAVQGIIPSRDEQLLLQGLQQIEEEIQTGRFPYREDLEDIHMNIERRLTELVGEEVGSRLHTGRSRNDQVSLDLRLFCLETTTHWRAGLLELQKTLVGRARQLKEQLFPGWTHLQAAQPLSWGHYLLALCQMFRRDFERLGHYQKLHDYSPLGAGALAGSTLPLEPARVARELGFSGSFQNSYDVVGDRDFILELLQVGSQIMLHASRLAEDFIYFSSSAVGWLELPDALCTGSSMMPQKKNPDVLELARGKCASVLGHTAGLAALIKGLPTSYHRDLQQDKEPLFAVSDAVGETLEVLPLVVAGFEIRPERLAEALSDGFLMATDLAEYLVGQGVPFRRAHEQVGKLVGFCVQQGTTMDQLPLETIREFAPGCGPEVQQILRPETALQRRRHPGSTGLVSVDQQIRQWETWIRTAGKQP